MIPLLRVGGGTYNTTIFPKGHQNYCVVCFILEQILMKLLLEQIWKYLENILVLAQSKP